VEDVASNAGMTVERTARIVDDLRYVIDMELMHAAQAVDLRRRAAPTSTPTAAPAFALGRGTGQLLDAYRREVGFLDRDRVQSDDIRKTYEFPPAPRRPWIVSLGPSADLPPSPPLSAKRLVRFGQSSGREQRPREFSACY
jgi:hypothetical protein